MKKYSYSLLAVFCLFCCATLFAERGVVSKQSHLKNCQIIKRVIDQELPEGSPEDQARCLSERLDIIAQKILSEGIDLSAYHWHVSSKTGYYEFSAVPVWEGDTIPLSISVMVWPSEQEARMQDVFPGDPENGYYHSCIHAHAMTCAFTVLEGTVLQRTYDIVEPSLVKLKEVEQFMRGDLVLDDNQDSFVHQLGCYDHGAIRAVTLHAYGAPTYDEVRRLTNEHMYENVFRYILEEDGTVSRF